MAKKEVFVDSSMAIEAAATVLLTELIKTSHEVAPQDKELGAMHLEVGLAEHGRYAIDITNMNQLYQEENMLNEALQAFEVLIDNLNTDKIQPAHLIAYTVGFTHAFYCRQPWLPDGHRKDFLDRLYSALNEYMDTHHTRRKHE